MRHGDLIRNSIFGNCNCFPDTPFQLVQHLIGLWNSSFETTRRGEVEMDEGVVVVVVLGGGGGRGGCENHFGGVLSEGSINTNLTCSKYCAPM